LPPWQGSIDPTFGPHFSSKQGRVSFRSSIYSRRRAADRGENRQAAGAIAEGAKLSCQVRRPAATETVKGPLPEYPSVASFWCRQQKRPQTKNRRSISGNAKYDRRACRSNTRTLRAQPAHYRSERNASYRPPRLVCNDAGDHAQRSCREHQYFRKFVGSQNANQHGDPHGPPKPATIVHFKPGQN